MLTNLNRINSLRYLVHLRLLLLVGLKADAFKHQLLFDPHEVASIWVAILGRSPTSLALMVHTVPNDAVAQVPRL